MASSPETAPPSQTNSSSLNNTQTNTSPLTPTPPSTPSPSPPATSAPPPSSSSPPPPPSSSSPPPPTPPSTPSPSPPATSAPPPSSPNKSSPPSPPLPPPSQPSPTSPTSSKSPPSSSNFSPPPPPKRPVKPSPSTPSPSSNDKNINSRKSSGGYDFTLPMVAGVAAGIALFIIIIVIMACFCCGKKKKKKNHNSMHYYSDSDVKGGDYYSSGAGPPKWHNGGPNAAINMAVPQGMAWHAPPPHSMNSEVSMEYSGPHGPALPPPSPALALGFIKSTFSYEQLASATNGFSHENLIGQGGFGYVYKGVLPNGKEVAVKQLKAGSGQGEREFQAEVEIISRVHHRHLVSLVGYCIAGSQRLLVYDFVPNKTLEFHPSCSNSSISTCHITFCPPASTSISMKVYYSSA